MKDKFQESYKWLVETPDDINIPNTKLGLERHLKKALSDIYGTYNILNLGAILL